MARDYYEILGVSRGADKETIKRAFRTLARDLHPDVSDDPDAEGRFRELSEAYGVLSKPESRRLYDRLGWRGRGRGFAPTSDAARVYASNPRAFFEDLESLLASGGGAESSRKPPEVVGEVEVDPYEAHVGAVRLVTVKEPRTCPTCGGSGVRLRTSAAPCAGCAGTGRRRVVSHVETGRLLRLETCSDCRGTGRPASGACADCEGSGEVAAGRKIAVMVPPRAEELERIPVGPDAVAVVRIVPARDKVAVRLAALGGLLAAIGFMLFLLAL